MVCLSTKMVLNTGGASRAGSTQRQTSLYHVTTPSFTGPNLGWSSGGWSPGHWPNFGAVKVKVVKQMKSEFVFVFFFFFTFGHSVSVRVDGLGQNDQFILLQFVHFCVIIKQYSLTVQVFTVAHRCAMDLWQRVLLCVYCNAIFICRIFQTHLYMYKCDLTLRDYQPADKSRHPRALKGCLLLHLIKP